MLTPENYIRKKARTLPLFECLVSTNWEEHGLPTVVIARKHTNGNITACTYMVDLKCLGVKDTSYLFNVSITEYRDFIDYINENIEMEVVEYALAHNIILAGVEYAEDLGFNPYKDYESVTKYMLEEDTDDIELIEIECGRNGKPYYMKGPNEDMAKANRIIAQLEKTVGFGNFDYILNEADQLFDPDDDEFEENWEEEDEFKDWTFKEKKDLFMTMIGSMEKLPKEEASRFMLLTNSMVEDLVDNGLCEQYYDELMEPLDMEMTDEEIPDELLGVDPYTQKIDEEWKTWFIDIFALCSENVKKARKELKLFKEKTNEIPAAYLLELTLLQYEKSPDYEKRLEEYARLFPDYAIIQLIWATSQVMQQDDLQKIPGYPFNAQTYFANRDFIHVFEMFYFMTLQAFVAGTEMDINKIEAFANALYDLDLPEDFEQVLAQTNTMQKIDYLLKYFKDSFQ